MKPPPRPAVGRPALYNDEVHAKLVSMARAGGFRKLQAMYAGVAERTLELWLEDARANPETSPYGLLLHHLDEAEAEKAFEALTDWGRGAKYSAEVGATDWSSAREYMAAKYPADYGRQVREHVGKDGGPLEFVVTWTKAAEEQGT